MAVSLVQTKIGQNAGGPSTGLAITLTATGAGSLLVLTYNVQANNPLTGVSDNKSNTWVKIDGQANSTYSLEMWYCQNPASAVTSVSVTYASNTSPTGVIVREYSGLTNRAVDVHAISPSPVTGANPASPATGITTQASELIIGYVATNNLGAPTAGSGFGNLTDLNFQTGNHIAMEDMVVAATGTQQATFVESSVTYMCGVASFIISSGGVAAGTYFPLLKN